MDSRASGAILAAARLAPAPEDPVHELTLTLQLVDIVEQAARSNGARRVHTVALELGDLAGVEVDALRWCFAAAARGTLVEGAALDIMTLPGRGWCAACTSEHPVSARFDPCPGCGGGPLRITAGTELRVGAIDIL